MFDDLPPDFPKLQLAAATIGRWGIGSPPEMKSIGERVRDEFLKTPKEDWPFVRRSHWKNLPYAFWIDGVESFTELPDLLDMYFKEHLLKAVEEPRAMKRWVKPLIFVYATYFKADSLLIARMARVLKDFATSSPNQSGSPLLALQNTLDFFSPLFVGNRIAKLLLDSPEAHGPHSEWAQHMGLWPTFLQSGLALHAHHCALKLMRLTAGNERHCVSLIAWAMKANEYNKYAPLPLFTEALLLPWANTAPSKALKERIIAIYTTQLSREDPRLNAGHWPHTEPAAKTILMRWIAADAMDLFFSILSQTAEPMWEYRSKFWQALLLRNVIDEVWPVLGSYASYIAKRSSINTQQYAELNGAMTEQSVLLMRMGDLIFAEWTHSGSLRVAEVTAIQAPSLYKRRYQGADLRFMSLPFEPGSGPDGLRHMGAESGSWQRKAAEFVRQKTGVFLKASDYL